MEKRGAINSYQCEDCDNVIFTVNLHAGVTPFISRCPYCGGAAQSDFYHVRVDRGLQITEAWYRPASLDGVDNPGLLDHFINAGLTRDPLDVAVARSAGTDDTTTEETTQEEWAVIAKKLWGSDLRVSPMGRLVES